MSSPVRDGLCLKMQVLQKQLEQLEQQLHIATTMERKLRSELEDVKAGRAADQKLAKQEVRRHSVLYQYQILSPGCNLWYTTHCNCLADVQPSITNFSSCT